MKYAIGKVILEEIHRDNLVKNRLYYCGDIDDGFELYTHKNDATIHASAKLFVLALQVVSIQQQSIVEDKLVYYFAEQDYKNIYPYINKMVTAEIHDMFKSGNSHNICVICNDDVVNVHEAWPFCQLHSKIAMFIVPYIEPLVCFNCGKDAIYTLLTEKDKAVCEDASCIVEFAKKYALKLI